MFRAWRKFCQFLLSSYTRKLTVKWILYTVSSSAILMWPTTTTVDFTISFGCQVPILGQQGRELSSVIQGYTQDLWNLLDKRLLKPKRHHSSWPVSWPISYSLLSFFSALLSMWGMSTALLWPLNQIVVVTDVLLLDCMSSLYILDINPLPDMILAKIFSHSSGCFFSFLIDAFVFVLLCRSFLEWYTTVFFVYFVVFAFAFVIWFKNSSPGPNEEAYCLHFL